MTTPWIVVAIDGPAASGKSSVSRTLARFLGMVYVNTGAMYRAVTWHVLRREVSPLDLDGVVALLDRSRLECGLAESQSTFHIDGDDPTPHLSDPAVVASVSQIATIPEVRRRLVELQRAYGQQHHVVMEGRDIGSAVFPHTPYKFHIGASLEVRMRRRHEQGFADSIAARDKTDSTRPNSPLIITEGTHIIDSSNLTIDGVVGEIFGRLKALGLRFAEPRSYLLETAPAA